MKNLALSYWHGEKPLWKIFWIYGLIGGLLNYSLLKMSDLVGTTNVYGQALSIISVIICVTYFIWHLVSVWRCAPNVKFKLFKTLVRLFIVLNIIGFTIIALPTIYINIFPNKNSNIIYQKDSKVISNNIKISSSENIQEKYVIYYLFIEDKIANNPNKESYLKKTSQQVCAQSKYENCEVYLWEKFDSSKSAISDIDVYNSDWYYFNNEIYKDKFAATSKLMVIESPQIQYHPTLNKPVIADGIEFLGGAYKTIPIFIFYAYITDDYKEYLSKYKSTYVGGVDFKQIAEQMIRNETAKATCYKHSALDNICRVYLWDDVNKIPTTFPMTKQQKDSAQRYMQMEYPYIQLLP